MKKCLGLAVLVLGAIVGAGFASGREVIVFWGARASVLVAPIVGLGFFLLCVLFLSIGSRLKKHSIGELNVALLGKFHFIADAFLLLNSLVLLAGMLSAMDALLCQIYPLSPLYSIISAVVCAVIVSKGLRAIVKCNVVVVPLIIIILVIICSFNITGLRNQIAFSNFSIWSTVLYVSMNMMLACSFFVSITDLKKSTIIIGSAIASIAISALLFILILALRNNNVDSAPLPILELAKKVDISLFYIGIIILAMSIFTTMLTSVSTLKAWVQSFGCGDIFSITIALIAGLIVSNLGFENVVAYLYPLIGIVGLFYITLAVIYLIKPIKIKSSKIKPSKIKPSKIKPSQIKSSQIKSSLLSAGFHND